MTRERPAADRLVPGLLHAARRRFLRFRARQQHPPTDRNPLGVKGVGEAGTIGAIPAVMNAVNDALAASARRRSKCRQRRRKSGARSEPPAPPRNNPSGAPQRPGVVVSITELGQFIFEKI